MAAVNCWSMHDLRPWEFIVPFVHSMSLSRAMTARLSVKFYSIAQPRRISITTRLTGSSMIHRVLVDSWSWACSCVSVCLFPSACFSSVKRSPNSNGLPTTKSTRSWIGSIPSPVGIVSRSNRANWCFPKKLSIRNLRLKCWKKISSWEIEPNCYTCETLRIAMLSCTAICFNVSSTSKSLAWPIYFSTMRVSSMSSGRGKKHSPSRSILADVTGGRSMINGSGIYFDQDKYYPHWYKNFFNKTIPLFGPYAWRADDFYGKIAWKIVSVIIVASQTPSIGETNGQITPFKRKILVLVGIISTRRGTIEAMNGTANGYPIKLETIRDEVKSLSREVEQPYSTYFR